MGVNIWWRKYPSGKQSAYLIFRIKGEKPYNMPLDIIKYPGESNQEKDRKNRLVEDIRTKHEEDIKYSRHGLIAPFKAHLNFIQFFQNYTDGCKNESKKRRSAATLNKFTEFVGLEMVPFNMLTEKMCFNFMNYLRDNSNICLETANIYWNHFKIVLQAAKREKIIRFSPTNEIKFKGIRRSPKMKKQILTIEEIKKLVLTPCKNQISRNAFLLGCYTGVGHAECKMLKWKNIKNDKISFFREKTKIQVINDLPDFWQKLIGNRKADDVLIFPELIGYQGVNVHIKDWVEKAGILKKITFYCARHSFAIMLLKNGADVVTVSKCLGHTNINTVMAYLNYLDEQKSQAIKRLSDPFD